MGRFAVLLTLLLVACGPPVLNADVTRFTTLAPGAGAFSFTILPDQAQTGSLEFEAYAQKVAVALAGKGWTPVPASADAQAVVTLHWGGGPPRTVTWQSPAYAWGAFGYRPWYGGGLAEPFPDWETRSESYWPKWLAMTVEDGPSWRAGRKKVLFEGRAVAEGRSPAVGPAVPALIQALLTGFPGISGTTVRVTVPY